MEKLSKEKIDQMVKSIKIDKANLEHIAKTGVINGTLLTELWRVILEGWAIGVGDSEVKKEPKFLETNLGIFSALYMIQGHTLDSAIREAEWLIKYLDEKKNG